MRFLVYYTRTRMCAAKAKECAMDIVAIGLLIGFFALSWGLIRLCERL